MSLNIRAYPELIKTRKNMIDQVMTTPQSLRKTSKFLLKKTKNCRPKFKRQFVGGNNALQS